MPADSDRDPVPIRPGPARSPQAADASEGFVTSADVARLAGVSRSAVSRTFTRGASVSPAMRTRVQEAASRLNYRVNRVAQSLTSAQSPMVGLVGVDLDAPFHAGQVAHLSAALLARGMQCLLLNAGRAEGDMISSLERILEFRARAVVILSGSPPTSIAEECLRRGLRVILVNKPLPGLAADLIVSDNGGGARVAADRLLAAGCRRLAVVSSGNLTPSLAGRIAAFRRRVTQCGRQPLIWSHGPTTYETGARAARELLQDGGIDGVFCVTDLLALGFMDGARFACGRSIPDDLSVIGFDDIPQAAWASYRLTTLRQPFDRFTRIIMRTIERTAAGQGRRIVVPVEFVERASLRAAT
jgi:DNA-binding LacI/PurR family transcriptional regulator